VEVARQPNTNASARNSWGFRGINQKQKLIMEREEITKSLKEQIGGPVMRNKEVAESKLFILDGIMAGDLPVYRKWVWKSSIPDHVAYIPDQLKMIFRIDIIQGRLQVDRIRFEDNGRVEFDTQNHSIVLDSDFTNATTYEWQTGIHKLMKYLRNE
tara:strand:+ start:352 stop:819 length:468 start_codon:yes stop_codon:yes gene_type:complete